MPVKLIGKSGEARVTASIDDNSAHGAAAAALRDPRYTRRLSDKIVAAFNHACDEGDTESAWRLLVVLERMMQRAPLILNGADRRSKESLVAAHERLWQVRHSEPPPASTAVLTVVPGPAAEDGGGNARV